MSKDMIDRDEVPDEFPFEETPACFVCGGEMTYFYCEECGGNGWIDIPAPDKECPKCHQRGGEWVCPGCGIAE